MWRSQRDESCYSPALKYTWDIVLPLMHIPIIDSDREQVNKLLPHIEALFSQLSALQESANSDNSEKDAEIKRLRTQLKGYKKKDKLYPSHCPRDIEDRN